MFNFLTECYNMKSREKAKALNDSPSFEALDEYTIVYDLLMYNCINNRCVLKF